MLLSLGTNQRSQLTRATVFYVAPFKSPLVHFAFLTSVLYFNLLTLCFLWSQQKQTSLLQWDKCHFFFFAHNLSLKPKRSMCQGAEAWLSLFYWSLSSQLPSCFCTEYKLPPHSQPTDVWGEGGVRVEMFRAALWELLRVILRNVGRRRRLRGSGCSEE